MKPPSLPTMMPATLRVEVESWARGRNPWVRLPLLLALTWILWRHLGSPEYASIVKGLNLAIHEAGHLFLGWLGEWIGIAGGTLFQLAAPVGAAFIFRRQRDWFAVMVALFWLGTNLMDVGLYAADARAHALPLVSPIDGEPLHDGYYLLSHAGLLRQDKLIGAVCRLLGLSAMAGGMVGCGWMLRLMRGPDRGTRSGPRPSSPP